MRPDIQQKCDPAGRLAWISDASWAHGPFSTKKQLYLTPPRAPWMIVGTGGKAVAEGREQDVFDVYARVELEYLRWLMTKSDSPEKAFYTCTRCKMNATHTKWGHQYACDSCGYAT